MKHSERFKAINIKLIAGKWVSWGLIFGALVSWQAGCATAGSHFRRGEELKTQEKYDAAIESYRLAANKNPKEPRYRLKLMEVTVEASNFYYRQGQQYLKSNQTQQAALAFNRALDYNPANTLASSEKKKLLLRLAENEKPTEKTAIEKLKEKTALDEESLLPKKDTLIDLSFDKEIELDKLLKLIMASAGINVVFDPAFKNSKVALSLKNISLKQALERICLIKELFYKVLDEKTILMIPDTEAKRKIYEDQIIKNFYLSNINAEDCVKLIIKATKVKNIFADPLQNSITVRETPERVALVEKLVRIYDKLKAEATIKVEIIEVNKNKLKQYGIELSQYQVTQSLTQPADAKGVSGNRFYYLNSSDFSYAIPSVIYNLMENDSDSKVIAQPHVRGVDGAKIEIKLGDKVPVPRTTFMPFATGGVAQQPITSFDLQDVGIEVSIVPHIHHNSEISLDLDFKFTFITSPGTSTMPPTIGNRSVKTFIRLRDGETGIMAGLLRDTERNSLKGIPGIANIPILRELFSSNSREITQTDIILSISPSIVRMPDIQEEDLKAIESGTEDNVHLKKVKK